MGNGRNGWVFTRPFEVIPARLDTRGCPVCLPESEDRPTLWGPREEGEEAGEDLVEMVEALDADALEEAEVLSWFGGGDQGARALPPVGSGAASLADGVAGELDEDDLVFDDTDRETFVQALSPDGPRPGEKAGVPVGPAGSELEEDQK